MRAPLIGAQRRALPFRRAALRLHETRPWHGDLGSPERSRQRLRPAAVPVADDARRLPDAIAVLRSPAIARARQHRCKFALDQLFDERAHPIAHGVFDRIEPVVKKTLVRRKARSFRVRLAGKLKTRQRNAILRHGVVSRRALQRQAIRG